MGPSTLPEGVSALEHHRNLILERALQRIADRKRRLAEQAEKPRAVGVSGYIVSPIADQIEELRRQASGKAKGGLFSFLRWGR
ncbi:hypothetical protein [Bauldia litoralis]|uniref:Uncharacterized protein n=1 Tax=Bauldia litoralis TaxID=665467 RepID=A0A1G6DV71_9HYPH|nr:hypothetical protein [Bauldia litoralis]SDB48695.1 hypothetical protein SAMN02982931_03780 [Bauldia litoralis]